MPTEPPKADPPKHKLRWFRFSLRTMMIGVALLASVAGISEGARGAGCDDQTKHVSNGADTLTPEEERTVERLYEGKLSPAERRDAIVHLAREYPNRHDSRIVDVFGFLLVRDRNALDVALPHFAAMIDHAPSERAIYDLCDLVLIAAPDKAPPEMLSALERVRRNSESYDYAKPMAVVILLKYEPERSELLSWLCDRIQSKKRVVRLTAAECLGRLKASAKPAVPRLVQLLNDEETSVRVIAATALWRINHDPAQVFPVLRAALASKAVPIAFRPTYFSENAVDVKCFAAGCLGQMKDAAKDAADDLSHVMLTDEDTMNRVVAARALGEIGADTMSVIAALEKAAARGDRDEVGFEAKKSLEKLRRIESKQ